MESSSVTPRPLLRGSYRTSATAPRPEADHPLSRTSPTAPTWQMPRVQRDPYIAHALRPTPQRIESGLEAPAPSGSGTPLLEPLAYGLALLAGTPGMATVDGQDLVAEAQALACAWHRCLLQGRAHPGTDSAEASRLATQLAQVLQKLATRTAAPPSLQAQHLQITRLQLQLQQDRLHLRDLAGPPRSDPDAPSPPDPWPDGLGHALLHLRQAERSGPDPQAVNAALEQLRADAGLGPADLALLTAPPAVPFLLIVRGLRQGLGAPVIRAMWRAGVPLLPHTVPHPALQAALDSHTEPLDRQPLPGGHTHAVERVVIPTPSGPQAFIWRPENPDASANVMVDCGIRSPSCGPWPAGAPRLCSRQMLAGELAHHLGIGRHVQVVRARPVVLDGVYGVLTDEVAGLQSLVLSQPQPVRLPAPMLERLRADPESGQALLTQIGQHHGLTALTLTRTGVVAEVVMNNRRRTPFPLVRPVDTDDPAVRRAFTAAAWLHLLTGEVDFHLANIGQAPCGPDPDAPRSRLTLYDNDLSFGGLLRHPEDAVNNLRGQPPGPRTRPERGQMTGQRFPQVIPADLAHALCQLTHADLLACGAGDHLSLPELEALKSRLGHIQTEILRLSAQDPCAVLADDAWLTPETTQRLGLVDIERQARSLAAEQRHETPGSSALPLTREIASFGLLRELAVTQALARRHPEQRWFPVLLDDRAIARDLENELAWTAPTRLRNDRSGQPAPLLSPRLATPRPGSLALPELPPAWSQWAQLHGLQPSEARSLMRAGFTEQDLDHLPPPDLQARRVERLKPVQPPPGRPPEGWTALSVQPASGPAEHYWFQPIQDDRGLRQLNRSLFVQYLADCLGVPAAVPQVHPAFHGDGESLRYGLLMQAAPGAAQAVATGLDTRSGQALAQTQALEWIGVLSESSIEVEDLVWFPGAGPASLRPRLPLPEPLSTHVPLPAWAIRLPERMDATMASRLRELDQADLVEQAGRRLPPDQGTRVLQRVALAQEAMANGERQVADESAWLEPAPLDDLGLKAARTAARQARTESDRDQARVRAARHSLAARIVLEHGLALRLASPPGSPYRSPLGSPPGSPHRSPAASPPGSPRRSARPQRRTLPPARSSPPPSGATADWQDRLQALETQAAAYALLVHAPLPAASHAEAQIRHLLELEGIHAQLRQTARDLQAEVPAERLPRHLTDPLDDDAIALPRALALVRHLAAQQVALPEPRPSAQGLMALVMTGGGSAESIAHALAAGASMQEIVSAQMQTLPPVWALLASQLLEAAAALPGAGVTRGELQRRHPLPEVAVAALKVVGRPRPRKTLVVAPATPLNRTTHAEHIGRAASRLYVSQAVMTEVLEAAKAHEDSRQRLQATPVLSDALASARSEAMQAHQRLLHALDQLYAQHQTEEGDWQRGFIENRRSELDAEHYAMSQLGAAVVALRKRLPADRLDITAGELLPLQAQDGPDPGYQALGLMAGWRCSDILLAHRNRWPSWAMACGPEPVSAEKVYRKAASGMGRLLNQLLR